MAWCLLYFHGVSESIAQYLNKHILLVEDEAIIAMDESRSLSRLGYRVTTVHSGEAALTCLDEHSDIDLVLMDIDLGRGMDGTQCAVSILEKRDIPILFVSSHIESQIVERTEAITVYGYVPKGAGEAVLNASIKMAFRLFDEKRQRKDVEDSILKSNQMLRKIIDSVHQSIFWKDMEGRYLGCNKTFANTVRIEHPDDIIGMTDYDLPWPRHEADDYRADDKEVILTGKSKLHIIEPLLGADGVRRIIDTSKHPLFNEHGHPFVVIGIYSDITEVRRAQEYLQKKDSAFEKLASQVPGMLYEFLMKPDGSFSVPFSSQGVIDIFGCSPEDVKDDFSPIFNAIYDEDKPLILRTIEESATSLSQWKCEYRVQLPGKPIQWIYGNSIPEKQKDGSIRWYGYNVDISLQKAAQDEIKAQLKSKVTLLKEVHHRIKNNIASIASLLSIQADMSENPEVKNELHHACSRIESLKLLYNILLSGDEYETMQIKGYLEKVIQTILEIHKDEIHFSVHLDFSDFTVYAKKVFPIGIIVNELMTNIIKYAFPGKDNGNVYITLNKEFPWATLVIRDDGVGMDAANNNDPSNGFGISLVKLLSDQIGGSFSIDGTKGTQNTIRFPIEAEQISLPLQ
ncbi:MAG: response regulator [Candidatus Latescibacteria bacterium]|nr:response regulator [Candidatus Latescibacterota bacterium]